MPKPRIVVIAIGQTQYGDDAAGLEIVRMWQKTHPQTANDPQLRVEQSGMPGMELIDLMAKADCALLVDAIQSGAEPGKLYMVRPEQVAPSDGAGSTPGWTIAETVTLAKELHYPLPPQLYILGIEATSFEAGAALSKPVVDSLAQAVEMIEERIHWWWFT